MPFSSGAQQILRRADVLGRSRDPGFVGVEHLLLALLESNHTEAESVLQCLDAVPELLAQTIRDQLTGIPQDGSAADPVEGTPRYHRVLKWAHDLAVAAQHADICPAHILLAMIAEGESWAVQKLEEQGYWSLSQMIERLVEQMQGSSCEEEILSEDGSSSPVVSFSPVVSSSFRSAPGSGEPGRLDSHPSPSERAGEHPLSRYGRDLMALARRGKLSMPIGQDELIRSLARVMVKRSRNNVLLLGEPGVGKTTLVEGLALRLLESSVDPLLAGKYLVELSAGALVAGTIYRGQLEERMQEIIGVASADPNLILFIDEFHQVVRSGTSADGHPGLKDLLLPALGRGDIRLVAATTPDDFVRVLENEQALLRRFEIVRVPEPDLEHTRQILQTLRVRLEEHHSAHITDEAIEQAIHLTVRHLPQRRLPDKAYDVLDQAAARARLRSLRAEIGEDEIVVVEDHDVAKRLSELTGIPLERLMATEAARVRDIESKLSARVYGQEKAIQRVSRVAKAAFAGLAGQRGPMGSLLFVGPTGVGKTEMAKALAESLYDGESSLVRLDMSEYASEQGVQRLIGAAPGLIGHENEGQLTGMVRRRPYSVVLLDEIEKAHPMAFDLLLQVLDEGRLTDSHNRLADFRYALIIMTSNLELSGPGSAGAPRMGFAAHREERRPSPSGDLVKGHGEARGADDDELRQALVRQFRPEFVNRIDGIIEFKPLGLEVMKRIAMRMVEELNEDLSSRELRCRLDQNALALLTRLSHSPTSGARGMHRVFMRLVREPIAEAIVAGKLRPGDLIQGSEESSETIALHVSDTLLTELKGRDL